MLLSFKKTMMQGDKLHPEFRMQLENTGLIKLADIDALENTPPEARESGVSNSGGCGAEYDEATKTLMLTLSGVVFPRSWIADLLFDSYFGMADIRDAVDAVGEPLDCIHLKLDSPGGMVTEMNSVMSYLKDRKCALVTEVVGEACSAASVIFCLGETRIMNGGAQIMIHECHGGQIGRQSDMEAEAKHMDNTNNAMAKVYADTAGGGKDVKYFRREMGRAFSGEWYDAAAALEIGFATEIREIKESAENGENQAADMRLKKTIDRFRKRGDKTQDVAGHGNNATMSGSDFEAIAMRENRHVQRHDQR